MTSRARRREAGIVFVAALAYACVHNVDGFAPTSPPPPRIAEQDRIDRKQQQLMERTMNGRLRSAFVSPHYESGLGAESSRFRVGGSFALRSSVMDVNNNSDDDDEEEEDEEDDDEEISTDPYMEKAASEFLDEENSSDSSTTSSSGLAPMSATSLDWGGEYSKLSERVDDARSGRTGPSQTLFRLLSDETPNEAIGKFVNEANPEVIAAMTGAVSSLLGGLSNPSTGVEVVVKATGEKLGNLCFQLQMTGYMFRNAEYVLALKEIMNLHGSATLKDYRRAFNKLDVDDSGYIESSEIELLLRDVYGDEIPPFEVQAFLRFFDSNNDGRISWEEFERGLGAVGSRNKGDGGNKRALPGSAGSDVDDMDEYDEEDEDDEEEYPDFEELFGTPSVSGRVQVELKNGKTMEVEAEKLMNDLKEEAEALKEALRIERGEPPLSVPDGGGGAGGLVPGGPAQSGQVGGIASYIASLQGDVKSLTEGISPEVVDTMKLLIKFVLEGGPKKKKAELDKEMEVPGSALQQLALWQLVLGYRLREQEATGDFRKLLDS